MSNTDYRFTLKESIIGLQFLFVAFGALVLVPILTGLDPNVALFTAGLGTLIFQLVTRKAVPPVFFGLIVCVYRTDYLWRQNMGYRGYHEWACGGGSFLCGLKHLNSPSWKWIYP